MHFSPVLPLRKGSVFHREISVGNNFQKLKDYNEKLKMLSKHLKRESYELLLYSLIVSLYSLPL